MGTSKLIPDSAYIDKVNQLDDKILPKNLLLKRPQPTYDLGHRATPNFQLTTIIINSNTAQKSNLFLQADNLDFAAAFSRIECHYFVNG